MPGLEERENKYEQKFAHDEEVAFKMRAKRDRLIGLWAAKQMHYNEERAETYATSLVSRSMGQNVNILAELIQQDLSLQGLNIELLEIRQEAESLLLTVQEQFMQEQQEESQ